MKTQASNYGLTLCSVVETRKICENVNALIEKRKASGFLKLDAVYWPIRRLRPVLIPEGIVPLGTESEEAEDHKDRLERFFESIGADEMYYLFEPLDQPIAYKGPYNEKSRSWIAAFSSGQTCFMTGSYESFVLISDNEHAYSVLGIDHSEVLSLSVVAHRIADLNTEFVTYIEEFNDEYQNYFRANHISWVND